ncbi:MAG: PDZ domain-containing protein, partial [bacterium]|nr:PDZ domain-containing protein [bacterium]
YIGARLMGVRVEVFSLGLGKRIFGKKIGATDFRFSLVPFAGFIRMAGKKTWNPDAPQPHEFHSKSSGRKVFILLMGPLLNLLCTFIIFTIVNMSSIEVAAYKQETPVIGYVQDGSPAANIGIQKGDRVSSINGTPISNWKELELEIGSRPTETVKIEIERKGKTIIKELAIGTFPKSPIGDAGISYEFLAEIVRVTPGSPAARAGLKTGDVIQQVDNTPVFIQTLSAAIQRAEGNALILQLQRGEKTLDIQLVPKKVYRLESAIFNTEAAARTCLNQLRDDSPELDFYPICKGMQIKIVSRDFGQLEEANECANKVTSHLKPAPRWIIGITNSSYVPLVTSRTSIFTAMRNSISNIGDILAVSMERMQESLSGKLKPVNLSGPIEIARVQKSSNGPPFIWVYIALVSMSIACINLFPLFMFDGGHIVICAIEAIRRKDFSLKLKARLTRIGITIFILFNVFYMLNDIARSLPKGWSSYLPF